MLPYFEITVPAYTLFALIGVIITVIFLFLRMEQYKIEFLQLLFYLIPGIVGLLVFSRLLFAVAMIPSMEGGFSFGKFADYIWHGGIVFYGGLLGVLFSVKIVGTLRNDNLEDVYNYMTPAIPLFHAIARIGCLFAGCCYGIPWNWGVIMAASPDVVRFPVQFVESCCDLIIFSILIVFEKRKQEGSLLYVYLVLYAVCRFVLEFFRGDVERGIWGHLSTAQIISIAILVVVVFRIRKKKGAYKYEKHNEENVSNGINASNSGGNQP